MSDPRVAAVPVRECGEQLVDVRDHGLLLDTRKQHDSDSFFFLRAGVAGREEPRGAAHHVARPDQLLATQILVTLDFAPGDTE